MNRQLPRLTPRQMQKCIFSTLVSKNITRRICQQHVTSLTHAGLQRRPGIFAFSTSKTRPSSQTDLASIRHETLTLQHKIEKILEDVFRIEGDPLGSSATGKAVHFWRDVLSDTFENLSGASERPARVAILGMDQWAGAEDLITALLEEPLNCDQIREDALRNRWKDAGHSASLTITTQSKEPSSPHLRLSSSYLSQFSVPVEFIELPCSVLSKSPSPTLPTALFKADIPIIMFNPLTTSLSTFERIVFPSHTIFVSSGNSHLNHSSLQHIFQNQFTASSPNLSLLFIDSSRALKAVQAFRINPASPLAVQQYQDNFTDSGISHITKTIRDVVDSGINTPSPSAFLRNRTAIIQLQDVLGAFHVSAQSVQRSLDDIRGGISRLTGRIEEAKAKAQGGILGFTVQSVGNGRERKENEVGQSLRRASKDMKEALERLSWWKAMWRVDDMSGVVGGAVDKVWCRDLEKKLILETGGLLSLQTEFTNSASTLVNLQSPTPPSSLNSNPPPSTPLFSAHILKNKLSQLKTSPLYALTPSSLTYPISKRKDQLLTYPTVRLHLTAQRALLGMSAGVAGSTSFTWAAWMGYLLQNSGGGGSGVWDVVGMGMDPTTGIGVGLLGIAASVRWAMGKWEREKKKWWNDWERIGQGLERDLKSTVDDVMTKQVVVIADAACSGLEELCQKHQGDVDQVKDNIRKLQEELENITSRTQV